MANLFARTEARRPAFASPTPLRIAMLTVALICAGCGRLLDGQPTSPGTIEAADGLPIDLEAPYPPAVVAAIERLAEERGVVPQVIKVVSYEEVEWPDGCLGLPGPNEACSEAVTPGWRVILNLAGEILIFRADAIGAELREE